MDNSTIYHTIDKLTIFYIFVSALGIAFFIFAVFKQNKISIGEFIKDIFVGKGEPSILEEKLSKASGDLKEITDSFDESRSENQRLQAEIEKLKKEIMPFVDKDNDNYTAELDAAVSAWRHFNDDTGYWTKERVQSWLKKEYSTLSDNAVERISVIINPKTRKKGGAPKTLEK